MNFMRRVPVAERRKVCSLQHACEGSHIRDSRLIVLLNMTQPASEAEIARCCSAQDYERATELVLRAYGAELYRFVRARLHSDADAHDVMSLVREDVWRGLPTFQWKCAVRAWMYTLAHHAHCRFTASAHYRRAQRWECCDSSVEAVASPRTATSASARTTNKDRLRALRARLTPADRQLLQLRVDRRLSWADIARQTLANSVSGAVVSEEARVRKRFQLIKERLRRWATAEGLIESAARD